MSASLISLAEAASRYGLGQTTLWRWLRDGQLKRYRRAGDRRTFVDEEELRQLVAPREVSRRRERRPRKPPEPSAPEPPARRRRSNPRLSTSVNPRPSSSVFPIGEIRHWSPDDPSPEEETKPSDA